MELAGDLIARRPVTFGEDGSNLSDPTRPSSPPVDWAMAGVVALQWAMLQAVVLGLDYLRAIKVSLTKDGD